MKIFFLSPAFRFPEVSDEDVSIDGPSNSSSFKLTTTSFRLPEDYSPGLVSITLCLQLIWVDKAAAFPNLSLQNLQVRGFSSQTRYINWFCFSILFCHNLFETKGKKRGLFQHFSTNLTHKADYLIRTNFWAFSRKRLKMR